MITDPTAPGYYSQACNCPLSAHRTPEQISGWPARDPSPEVTTRDPRPEGVPGYPSAVIKLQRAAGRAGWSFLAGYSRGPERAAKIGTYKIVEAWGVYVPAHPETGWRFGAVYLRTKGAKSWAWRSIAIRRPGHLIGPGMGAVFVHATITDLYEFLAVRGSVGTPWFKAVQARVEEQAARTRAAARNRPKQTKEGSA